MSLESELKSELYHQGADFIHFVDVSQLSDKQNKQYPIAILVGIVLSPDFILKITNKPDYVQKMICNNQMDEDEFNQKEKRTDQLADHIARFLKKKGYSAYSQSEDNIYKTGFYNEKARSTPLPHKTIAGLAGLGWIGNHNLLVTREFGSAVSMCTVLTDAPLKTILHTPLNSQCGNCSICKNVCQEGAIKGNTWNINSLRDDLVDVHKCTTCLKCMVFCPFTQAYMNAGLRK
jgi:epoxyqueuosine reductase